MTREILYTNIINVIFSEFGDEINSIDDIKTEIELNGIQSVLPLLEANLPESKLGLKRIVKSMSNYIDSLDIDLENYTDYEFKRVAFANKSNKRDFLWCTTELTVFNCCDLFLNNSFNDELMLAVEKICYKEENISDFLHYINNDGGIDRYYLIYKSSEFTDPYDWQLYSFGLLSYLNKINIIKKHSNLDYTPTTFNTAISFNTDAKYQQYLDIYDVLSEWNYSTDILTAFLKMYQILEYIIYRKEFVSIVNGTSIKQSFVRQIKGIDKKYSNSEREAFKKGMKDIISSFDGKIDNRHITEPVELFCKKYYPLNGGGNTYLTSSILANPDDLNRAITQFIYDTRCAIVHNKESEFHITFFNYEEYKSIVPLMKRIIEVVGEKIIEILSDSNNSIIFSNQDMKLY